MGVLLAFMLLVNVFGAIFLLPAMACWLGVGARPTADERRPPPASHFRRHLWHAV